MVEILSQGEGTMRIRASRVVAMAVFIGVIMVALHVPARSAPLSFVSVVVVQPDGSSLHCFASGDEFYNWLHDADGYTILKDPSSGWFVYACLRSGRLIPSTLVAGRDDPRLGGLDPWLSSAAEVAEETRAAFLAAAPDAMGLAPRTGVINNLVVFIRFDGEPEFTRAVSSAEALFNEPAAEVSSMYNYFLTVSYGALEVFSTFYPVPPGTTVISYQDSHPRGYFQPADTTNPIGYTGGDNGTERRDREHQLLADAVEAIDGEVPLSLTLDGDNDGRVDNVCFVIYGSPTGWSSLLWPHRWALYSQTVTLNGKRVYDYNFQLNSSLGVSVLCHEMFHSLGAPDLYRYTDKTITPIGSWDLMATNTTPPQHMGAYMKFKYGGWISSIPTIGASGVYTLNPLTSPTGNSYKILSPFSSTEFFIVEYRRKGSLFEGKIPGEGLVIYRVNTARTGNASGPPDELYIYRPGGSPVVNGSLSSAAFSLDAGRSMFGDSSDPACFLTDGSSGGIMISDIGALGDSIVFRLGPPLPIQLSWMTAQASGPNGPVALEWQTVSEYNNFGFQVMRSFYAGAGYEEVPAGFVAGHGTTLIPQTYTFIDSSTTGHLYYRLKQMDLSGEWMYTEPVAVLVTGVSVEVVPGSFALGQNYPNPFNPETTIRFTVDQAAQTTLTVFDLLGREVARLFDERALLGHTYEVQLNGKNLASGVYLYVLTTGRRTATKHCVLLR
jgi:M6 family metalloprotease-like protein